MNSRVFSWSLLFVMSCGVLLNSAAMQMAYAQTAETATVSADAPQPPIATPLKWESSGVLVRPISDESHTIVSVKDPTVIHFDGLWHIYATAYSTSARTWSMVFLNFKDWSEAPNVKLTYIDVNPNLKGYHCAPHLFYFTPDSDPGVRRGIAIREVGLLEFSSRPPRQLQSPRPAPEARSALVAVLMLPPVTMSLYLSARARRTLRATSS